MDEHSGQTVNIVVTSYNRREATVRCLQSILSNTDHPFRLTVVDDGSTDDTQSYLRYLKLKGKIDNLFLFKRNMGVAVAVNMGMFAEDTPFFLKFDNDNVVHSSDWLGAMVRKYMDIRDAGSVAYNIYNTEPEGFTDYCGGSILLFSKHVRETVGCFCEEYGRYGEEDSDFGQRILLSGLKNYYLAPEGRVSHEHGQRSYGSAELDARRSRASRREALYAFFFNQFLYENGLRPLFMVRRHLPLFGEDFMVDFKQSEEYEQALKSIEELKAKYSEGISEAVESYINGG